MKYRKKTDEQRKETEHMDRRYDIDPSNRIYSEEELHQVRERYLVKPTETGGSSRSSGEGRLGSAWKALLSLLTKAA